MPDQSKASVLPPLRASAISPRKAEKPLVVWFRLYGAEKRAMQAVAGKRRGAHNAIALAGTMAEIARLEAAALPVTPAELKAIASFKKVTGDASIVPTLSAAMRDSVLRSKTEGDECGPINPKAGLRVTAA